MTDADALKAVDYILRTIITDKGDVLTAVPPDDVCQTIVEWMAPPSVENNSFYASDVIRKVEHPDPPTGDEAPTDTYMVKLPRGVARKSLSSEQIFVMHQTSRHGGGRREEITAMALSKLKELLEKELTS